MLEVTNDGEGIIRIVGDATVVNADALRDGLVQAIEEERDGWMLDLGALGDLDSSGIQLLISLKRTVKSLRVHSCPAEARKLLESLGLAVRLL